MQCWKQHINCLPRLWCLKIIAAALYLSENDYIKILSAWPAVFLLHSVPIKSYIVWNPFYSYVQATRKIQLDIVRTSLICNKPVVVYFNLDQNMCNHRHPATEETKKDKVVFWKHFRDHFYAI